MHDIKTFCNIGAIMINILLASNSSNINYKSENQNIAVGVYYKRKRHKKIVGFNCKTSTANNVLYILKYHENE